MVYNCDIIIQKKSLHQIIHVKLSGILEMIVSRPPFPVERKRGQEIHLMCVVFSDHLFKIETESHLFVC